MAAILLIGNYRPSLPLARSLARAGHAVYCGLDDRQPYLFKSRYVAGTFLHAGLEAEPELALRQIEQWLQAGPRIDVLLPVSDPAMRLLAAARTRFEPRVRVALPSPAVVEICADKTASFELCERLNVPVASRSEVHDYAELLEALRRTPRPCVVKPVDAAHALFGEKAVILDEDDDGRAKLPCWPTEHRSLCVQSFVGGLRHEVSFAAWGGELLGAVDCAVLRTDRADGTGYTTEVVSVAPSPAVAGALEALIAGLDYTGVGTAEFIHDEASGELTFLELDTRLGSCFRSAELCGLPLSRWMVEIACGSRPVGWADPWRYPTGRRLVWTKGDVAGLRRERRRGALSFADTVRWIGRAVLAALRSHHVTLDLRDLAPTLWIYLHGPLQRLGYLHPWSAAVVSRPSTRASKTDASEAPAALAA